MKTRTLLLAVLILGATYVPGIVSQQTCITATPQKAACKSVVETSAKVNFLACMGRYASYFRSFMPFDEDPCNHMPSHKSFC